MTEPFICPSLYEKYINSSSIPVVDEWTLSIAMGSNLATEMEQHYSTFIVSRISGILSNRHLADIRVLFGIDRARLCRDCWCGAELGSDSNWLLGNRNDKRRAVFGWNVMEILPEGVSNRSSTFFLMLIDLFIASNGDENMEFESSSIYTLCQGVRTAGYVHFHLSRN